MTTQHIMAEGQTRHEETEDKVQEPLVVFVIGKTGVGKSTLINSLLGNTIDRKAEVTHNIYSTDHDTMEEHRGKICDKVPAIFYDTRGLGDLNKNEKELMKKLKENTMTCSNRFLIFICQRFTDKVDKEFETFVKLLIKNFGDNYSIWHNIILVLTIANKYESDSDDEEDSDESDKMTKRMQDWSKEFERILKRNGIPEAIIHDIPVCAAGKKKEPKLLITPNWMETLLQKCTQVCLNNTERSPITSGDFAKTLSETVGLATAGAVIGYMVFGTKKHIIIGATIGALIGYKGVMIDQEKSQKSTSLHEEEHKSGAVSLTKKLDTCDINEIWSKLKKAGFPNSEWLTLCLNMGLHINTINEIKVDYQKCEDRLLRALTKWLEGKDNELVEKKGGRCWSTILMALKEIEQVACAEKLKEAIDNNTT